MSHEIRTPLTGVLGMAEILSHTSLQPKQAGYVDTLIESGENLRNIINLILDYSKLEAGQMQVNPTAFTLKPMFIVYAAFCNSWINNIWSSEGSEATLMAAAGAVVLFGLAVGLSGAGIRIFGFEHPNAMAILFCSPQKTLAAGVPLANLIFAGHPGLGLILLPIMFYHPLQLLAGGMLINRINKNRQP